MNSVPGHYSSHVDAKMTPTVKNIKIVSSNSVYRKLELISNQLKVATKHELVKYMYFKEIICKAGKDS